MYTRLDDVTHYAQMVREHGDTFMFHLDYDKWYTSDDKRYLPGDEGYKVFTRAIPVEVEALRLTDDRGRYAVITRSAKQAEAWQASYFDARGGCALLIR